MAAPGETPDDTATGGSAGATPASAALPNLAPAAAPDLGRLVITDTRGVTYEHRFTGTRLGIGRHAGCDVVLVGDHAVSSRHAVLVVAADGLAAISDHSSTNGTTVNGRGVSQQRLHDGDTIGIGNHRLVYRAPATPRHATAAAAAAAPVAGFVILHGPGAGGRLVLDRTLTRIGRPGTQMAAVTSRLDGHYIARVVGTDGATIHQSLPTLNGLPFGTVAVRLAPGDTVVIGGVTLVFERPLRDAGVLAALA